MLSELAKDSGLNPMMCPHCGRKVRVLSALTLLFRQIVRRLASGEIVRIKAFGTFKTKMHKARGITKEAGDRLVVGFEPVPAVKRKINA